MTRLENVCERSRVRAQILFLLQLLRDSKLPFPALIDFRPNRVLVSGIGTRIVVPVDRLERDKRADQV